VNVLCSAFKQSNIQTLALSQDDLLLFCSGDRRTDAILERLNELALEGKEEY
jgi:hypothetical protein